MQIVRKSSFTATPWKNGGGITYEVIRVPPNGAPFRWRLSVAQIDVSGPFSDFSGYDRKMILLRGCGVRLTFNAANPVSLTDVGDMAEFDGALKTECRLVDGPCTDLNLMVAQSLRPVTARVECLSRARQLPAADHGMTHGITLVFAISGGLWVDSDAELPVYLNPWDLAILPAGGPGTVAPDTHLGASSLVFLATLDDNSP